MVIRTVRTPEGAERYGVPVGSQIADNNNIDSVASEVSLVRLRSMNRLIKQLRERGSSGALAAAEREFNELFTAALPRLSPAQIQLVLDIHNGID